LRECLRRFEEGIDLPDLEGVRAAVGLPVEAMRVAVSALESADPPYIEVLYTPDAPDRVGGHVRRVSERARRELGTWPTVDGVVQAIIDGLRLAADQTEEPETKRRLRSAAEVVAGLGRDVLAQVIATKIGSVV